MQWLNWPLCLQYLLCFGLFCTLVCWFTLTRSGEKNMEEFFIKVLASCIGTIIGCCIAYRLFWD